MHSKPFTSQEIRDTFLEFFIKNDHKLILGSSILPKNDPTLLFINSGMAPMKPYFLGLETPPYPRLSNVQACIRTNDIEEVGDRHHLTFFEMMGSWSIGDYYKEKAIALAYDLLVNHFKFPPEKLYATVYKGNPAINLPPDVEAIRCWEKVGMPSDHIVPLGEDNFWGPAGDTGPCGPCTEVFFDTGDSYGEKYIPGGHFDDVNRYIEIWNAGVFMEFNKDKNGNFSSLPMKSVDTGSGIERMYLGLNGSNSLYDVDTIKPIYEHVKRSLTSKEISDRDIRLVTDHIRTSTFLLGQGVVPDKDGRGYIPRRLLRKSIACYIRAGKPALELEGIVENVVSQLSPWYPELNKNLNKVMNVLRQEINDFTPVINTGLDLLNNKIQKLDGTLLSGDFIFDLVATHGLPLDVIEDYAVKKGIKLETDKYLEEYRKHQEISRTGIKGKNSIADDNDIFSSEKFALIDKTVFVGYNQTETNSTIIGIIKDGIWVDKAFAGEQCKLIFNQTPFYAESGGQVGDSGFAINENSSITINDTQKSKNVFFHTAVIEKGTIAVNDILSVNIDLQKRQYICKNHTSTHLLHASLHKVLGNHATQKGSLVNSEKLRFDFVHNKPMTAEEIKAVEAEVNQWIWANYKANIQEMSYQSAIDSGAMAIFSENYGDTVRVVNFGGISVELCGGTHVAATGDIGLFMINHESSVAKGIRRIEAICGPIAYNQLKQSRDILNKASQLLTSKPENLVENIEKLKKSAISRTTQNIKTPKEVAFSDSKEIALPDGIKICVARLDQDLAVMQQEADKLLAGESDIVLIASVFEDTIKTIVTVKDKFQSKYQADVIIKKWLDPFNGKGGGKAGVAKGGMKDSVLINELLELGTMLFTSPI